jgi:DNA-binding MarR family transcriptional regulator
VAECAAFIRLCRDHLVPLVDNAPGVTRKELRILKDLRSERGDIAAAVARRLGIDDGEMSRLVKRLAARELLMRMPADSPRRSALRLTPTGRALVDRSTWADHVMLEARLEELTAAEQESLRRAMAVVSELLCETELD